jgi:hypothetical protein
MENAIRRIAFHMECSPRALGRIAYSSWGSIWNSAKIIPQNPEKKPKDTWHGAPEPWVEYFHSNWRVILNVSWVALESCYYPRNWVVVVVWTSLGPLPRWVPGPTTRWAPRTTRLALHGTWWRGAQGLWRRSTRLGSCTCPALYGRLLDVLDKYSLPTPTCNPASWTI